MTAMGGKNRRSDTEPLTVELIYNMAMDKGIPKSAYMKAYKSMNGNLKQLKQWVDVYMEGAGGMFNPDCGVTGAELENMFYREMGMM